MTRVISEKITKKILGQLQFNEGRKYIHESENSEISEYSCQSCLNSIKDKTDQPKMNIKVFWWAKVPHYPF